MSIENKRLCVRNDDPFCPDVLNLVFRRMDPLDLTGPMLVCKKWKEIIETQISRINESTPTFNPFSRVILFEGCSSEKIEKIMKLAQAVELVSLRVHEQMSAKEQLNLLVNANNRKFQISISSSRPHTRSFIRTLISDRIAPRIRMLNLSGADGLEEINFADIYLLLTHCPLRRLVLTGRKINSINSIIGGSYSGWLMQIAGARSVDQILSLETAQKSKVISSMKFTFAYLKGCDELSNERFNEAKDFFLTALSEKRVSFRVDGYRSPLELSLCYCYARLNQNENFQRMLGQTGVVTGWHQHQYKVKVYNWCKNFIQDDRLNRYGRSLMNKINFITDLPQQDENAISHNTEAF